MGKNKAMIFLGIGFELVALLLGGAYFGQLIDKHYGWPGFGTIGMILVVLISWFYRLILLLKRMEKLDDKDTH